MAEVIFADEEYPAIIVVDQWQFAVIIAALKSVIPDEVTDKLPEDYSACTQYDINRLIAALS